MVAADRHSPKDTQTRKQGFPVCYRPAFIHVRTHTESPTPNHAVRVTLSQPSIPQGAVKGLGAGLVGCMVFPLGGSFDLRPFRWEGPDGDARPDPRPRFGARPPQAAHAAQIHSSFVLPFPAHMCVAFWVYNNLQGLNASLSQPHSLPHWSVLQVLGIIFPFFNKANYDMLHDPTRHKTPYPLPLPCFEIELDFFHFNSFSQCPFSIPIFHFYAWKLVFDNFC